MHKAVPVGLAVLALAIGSVTAIAMGAPSAVKHLTETQATATAASSARTEELGPANQTGDQGEHGQVGDQGENGQTGDQGEHGQVGDQGEHGQVGDQK